MNKRYAYISGIAGYGIFVLMVLVSIVRQDFAALGAGVFVLVLSLILGAYAKI